MMKKKEGCGVDSGSIGRAIRGARESRGLTQNELGERIGVGGKAVSKWENGKGLPDISLLESLGEQLGLSVAELLSGRAVNNQNRSGNVLRTRFYLCPVCGNVIHTMGECAVSCCGIALPALEANEPDEEHPVDIEQVEDEHFLCVHHDMTKEHYITFVAFLTSDRMQFVKLYPEGNAQTRLQLRGHGWLYLCCNRHGLMRKRI